MLSDSDIEHAFNTWYQPLCRTAFRYLRDEKASEDIVQDVFVKLWMKRQQLSFRHSIKAYLYRSVINGSLNYIEKNKKKNFLSTDEWLSLAKYNNQTEENVIVSDMQQIINETISTLPPSCRQVFILSRFESLSNKEIAASMGISIKTVENQMTKALKLFKLKFKDWNKNLPSWLFLLT